MARMLAYMATPGGMTGAPKRLLALASVLREEGIEVSIASKPDSELLSTAAKNKIRTIDFDAEGFLSLRKGELLKKHVLLNIRIILALLVHNIKFLNLIRKENCDFVWIRSSKSLAFVGVGVFLSRKPLIWDVDYELESKGTIRLLHRFGLWLSRSVVFQYSSAPDSIFGRSLAGKYRGKFSSIIPGVELSTLAALEEGRVNKGCSDAPFIILQVGTVCERKNQKFIIDVIKSMKRKSYIRDFHLLIAGDLSDDAYVSEISAEIEKHNLAHHVRFLGWRDDIKHLMATSDILVMPSRDEGVPNTVQEAMAIGLPVIASNTGGMPEIIAHERTGWVLPLSDVKAWVDRIEICINNPEKVRSISQEASTSAKLHFSMSSWGEKYAAVIRKMLGT